MSKINLHNATLGARRLSLANIIKIAINNLTEEFGQNDWKYEGCEDLGDKVVMSFSLRNRQIFKITIEEDKPLE